VLKGQGMRTRVFVSVLTVASLVVVFAGSPADAVGPAAKLVFTTQPGVGANVAPNSISLAVSVEDAAGNVETGDTSTTVTLAVASGPGVLACAGGLTATVSAGVASFSCSITTAGAYTLNATSSPPLGTATSNSFNVTQYLTFSTQPGNGASGVALPTQPVVTLKDVSGTTINDNSTLVTLAIASGPPGAVLTCAPVTAAAGVATFAGCKIDKVGTYTLTATGPAYAPATSASFTISVGPAAKLVFTTQPGNGTAGAVLSTQPVVAIEDAGGNVVTSDTSVIALSITPSTGTAAAVLSCSPVNAVAGVATFAGCAIDRAGTGYEVDAADSTDSLSATSTPFNVSFVVPTRIFGQDAIGTSIAISAAEFPQKGSAGAVVLARTDFFSDALAGGPLAAAKNAPLLITPGAGLSSTVDARVLTEIQRVLPTGHTVYILGGPLALDPGIDTALQGLGYTPVRVQGANEFATAVAVAHALGDPSTVFEATGLDFADALSAVPAAIETRGAIVLTDGSRQAAETAAYLAANPSDVRYAIGGPLAAAGADPQANTVFGQDLYGTSAAVATTFFPAAAVFGAATGLNYPDALSGGVFMATHGRLGPVLLVQTSAPLPAGIAQYLAQDLGTRGYVFGGPLAVGADVLAALQTAVGG
jgi:hypothetical protein